MSIEFEYFVLPIEHYNEIVELGFSTTMLPRDTSTHIAVWYHNMTTVNFKLAAQNNPVENAKVISIQNCKEMLLLPTQEARWAYLAVNELYVFNPEYEHPSGLKGYELLSQLN